MATRKSKCSQTGDLNLQEGAIFSRSLNDNRRMIMIGLYFIRFSSQNVCFNNVYSLKKCKPEPNWNLEMTNQNRTVSSEPRVTDISVNRGSPVNDRRIRIQWLPGAVRWTVIARCRWQKNFWGSLRASVTRPFQETANLQSTSAAQLPCKCPLNLLIFICECAPNSLWSIFPAFRLTFQKLYSVFLHIYKYDGSLAEGHPKFREKLFRKHYSSSATFCESIWRRSVANATQ